MDRTERLLTRLALEELNAEFAYLIDHDLSEQVADLFTEDGSYGRSTGERSVGREAIRAAYRGRKNKGAVAYSQLAQALLKHWKSGTPLPTYAVEV